MWMIRQGRTDKWSTLNKIKHIAFNGNFIPSRVLSRNIRDIEIVVRSKIV